MGLLGNLKKGFSGENNKDWNQQQTNSSNNQFSMPDPNLRGMATGEVSTIPTLEPVSKLTKTRVELEEQNAKEWREQEQLHGRWQAAKTSTFQSHSNISVSQFKHGQKRVQIGLKARDQGATKFGEFLFSGARPELASQNYRVQLSQKYGERAIDQLGTEYNQAVEDLDARTAEM